jgi:hypothetical protein
LDPGKNARLQVSSRFHRDTHVRNIPHSSDMRGPKYATFFGQTPRLLPR